MLSLDCDESAPLILGAEDALAIILSLDCFMKLLYTLKSVVHVTVLQHFIIVWCLKGNVMVDRMKGLYLGVSTAQ